MIRMKIGIVELMRKERYSASRVRIKGLGERTR